MVGLNIRYALLTLSATLLATIAVVGQQDENRYKLLQRQERQLQLRAESVSEKLASSRRLYDTQPSDSLASVVGMLDYQYSAIVERSGAIRKELQQLDSLKVAAERAAELVEETEAVAPQQECHPERDAFKAIGARYADDELLIPEIAGRYAAVYARTAEALGRYRNARNIASLEAASAEYAALSAEAKTLADSIADGWDYIAVEKGNAYSVLADSLGLSELKNDYNARAHRTEEELDALVGRCSDGDVAIYPLRKRDLLEYERRLAANIGLAETADSLAAEATAIVDNAYQLELLRMNTVAADAAFEEVVIEKKVRYTSTKTIKPLTPPSKGYAYSILLGSFKEQPKISTFRNAAPLFSERRADGRTYYYAGLYPTEQSAADAIDRLRAAGFKQPEIVMWLNSLRRDDFVSSITSPNPTAGTTVYKVEILGAPATLTEEAMAIVRRDAPRKEVSKIAAPDGTYTYTVGTFTSRNEAEAMSKAMSALLKSTVIEIVL